MFNNDNRDICVNYKIYEERIESAEFNKLLAILFLSASIIIVSLPRLISFYWIIDGMSENDLIVFFILPCIQLYQLLFCQMILKRVKQRIGAFDFIWYRWDRSELHSILLLALNIIFVFVFAYIYIRIIPVKKISILTLRKNNTFFIVWQFIYIVILFPIFEEMFWRGYIQSILARISCPLIAIPLQSILFGLYHFRPLVNTLPLCVIGIIFGIWRQKRNTLIPLIIAHIIINLSCFFILWKDLIL